MYLYTLELPKREGPKEHPRIKISVNTDISVIGFYENIGGYFYKNIGY